MDPRGTGGLFEDWYLGKDDLAWGDLLERLRPRFIWSCSVRMSAKLRAWIEPEDMAQVVLAAIHTSRDQFQGGSLGQFLGWCFTIADHRIRDAVDEMKAEKRTPPTIQIVSFSQTSPSEPARRKELVERVREVLDRMESPYKETFELSVLQEMQPKAIAAVFGQPEATVRTWKYRAIRIMRDALGGLGPISEGLGAPPIDEGCDGQGGSNGMQGSGER